MPLTADSRIVAGDERLRPLAEVLSGEIALFTGVKLPTATGEGRDGDIVLRIDKDVRVDVKGVIGSPDDKIGRGNIANLVGDTKICYPAGDCDLDVITNGFALTLDSGDGNAFSCTGSISGTGNVEFYMGPSYTGFKDCAARGGGRQAEHHDRQVLRQEGPRPARKSRGASMQSPGT